MNKILSVKNLQKIYEGKMSHTALSNVSFDMEKGEFTAVMGPSGSGKSTLLQVISTIDSPTSGNVYINGKNPHTLSQEELASFRRNQLGFIFQDFNLIHTLTVEENIMLPLSLENVPAKEVRKRTKKIAEYLGISKLLPKRTFEISGGQAQRVAAARALVHNPSLILADEPTGNLDSKATNDVMKLLKELNRKMDSTILMVTHDAYVASMCGRVLFIKDGRLYQEMTAGDSQTQFYQNILDMLTFLGGGQNDIASNRI
ncbi:MAG: ABC transporter ATP-binding protein [Ruminococcus sp.]|uniref:ABC transporter ATP-binding protein n=1 Tax=Schaedlerella arabinosiphila TaxID=2044587 RepID=A0A426DPA4_9FIRM|nr:ABC transporter ATP-binding protein [Schaedlerella arabinosiphila]MCI8722495.1 ABC transporter ATP-binding protein [Ruminococcus sp.]RRK34615.1 ABC transporter ATP-binding protein [Schaedlerella arabinosiphila]